MQIHVIVFLVIIRFYFNFYQQNEFTIFSCIYCYQRFSNKIHFTNLLHSLSIFFLIIFCLVSFVLIVIISNIKYNIKCHPGPQNQS